MINFSKSIQKNFDLMSQTGKLFRANVPGREVWDLYLHSFQDGDDPVFRDPESSEHNCNHCKNFVRRYGNIIAIRPDGSLMTIFDVNLEDVPYSSEYIAPALAISDRIKRSGIYSVFFETFEELNSLPYEKCTKTQDVFRLGVDKNVKRYTREEAELYGVVKPNEVRTFNHMFLNVPSKYVSKTNDSVESIVATYRDKKEVFKRAMTELSLSSLELAVDLINQGSLLDGTSHLHDLQEMIKYKNLHNEETIKNGDNIEAWYWAITYGMAERTAKFKNHLIGVFCTDLESGEKDLEANCREWNRRVDPANFMKATAPITKRQIADAEKFLIDNDYVESFDRRHATIEDIAVSEIKHVNTGDVALKSFSMFDAVKPTRSKQEENFEHVKQISIEDFMSKVLPTAESVQVYLENRMTNNMVNLTTSAIPESKKAFKWNNNFSWTVNGNLAGISLIQQAVKSAGGKIDGILRYSISWNEDGRSIVDFDAHCKEPDGHLIYFGSKTGRLSGTLDVDMIRPQGMGVENIVYTDQSRMRDGKYRFVLHRFDRQSNNGFKAQIEFGNQIFDYEVVGNVEGYTDIATVTLEKGVFSIEHHLPHTSTSREVYGLETNNFHKVNLISTSPNHWGENAIGNKYFFFMLEGCKTDLPIRSFHVENLNQELAEHRKVMEVVGNVNMIKPDSEQLAGVGFNSTVRDSVVVKVNARHVMRITF